jgi:hypothetical protein
LNSTSPPTRPLDRDAGAVGVDAADEAADLIATLLPRSNVKRRDARRDAGRAAVLPRAADHHRHAGEVEALFLLMSTSFARRLLVMSTNRFIGWDAFVSPADENMTKLR